MIDSLEKNDKFRRADAPIPCPTRILCVDDDPDVQTAIELKMQQFDVVIEHAFHGNQGILETMKSPPDLITMDLAMPNGDGEFLLGMLRRNAATLDIPVIVLTGMRDPTLKNRVMMAGADVFLHKPVRFEDLLHEISRFVDLRPKNQERVHHGE